jgi:hypothetical protein
VSIRGAAREGTASLSAQFEAFVQGMQKGLPSSTALRDHTNPKGDSFTIDLCCFAPPEAAPDAAAAKEPAKEPVKEAPKPAPHRERKTN